jgi:cytoskeletal protein RodZ
MASVGERLRRERQAQNRSLAEIAQATKVSARHLAAIEADDWNSLPGDFFAKSFAEQYARLLGIADPEFEQQLDRMREEQEKPLIPGQELPREGMDLPPVPSAVGRKPLSRQKTSTAIGMLAGVLVVCTLLFALWQRQQRSSLQEGLQVPRAQPAASRPTPSVQTAPAEPPAVVPAPVEPVVSAPESGLSVQIEAKERTWVEVTSNGKVLFSGILEPSQTKKLAGVERARLVVGNAGGLQITSNGKDLGPIGPSGQVRVVVLTPEGSRIFTPQKQSSDDALSEGIAKSPSV